MQTRTVALGSVGTVRRRLGCRYRLLISSITHLDFNRALSSSTEAANVFLNFFPESLPPCALLPPEEAAEYNRFTLLPGSYSRAIHAFRLHSLCERNMSLGLIFFMNQHKQARPHYSCLWATDQSCSVNCEPKNHYKDTVNTSSPGEVIVRTIRIAKPKRTMHGHAHYCRCSESDRSLRRSLNTPDNNPNT